MEGCPGKYNNYTADLVTKVVALSWVSIENTVCVIEESRSHETPYAASHMNCNTINSIIYSSQLQDLNKSYIE
jgi:hypothetical protein